MGIFGEYDNSCTGEGMPSPYNQKQNITDKSEFSVPLGIPVGGMREIARNFATSAEMGLTFRPFLDRIIEVSWVILTLNTVFLTSYIFCA